jgi:hypothetical protein
MIDKKNKKQKGTVENQRFSNGTFLNREIKDSSIFKGGLLHKITENDKIYMLIPTIN